MFYSDFVGIILQNIVGLRNTLTYYYKTITKPWIALITYKHRGIKAGLEFAVNRHSSQSVVHEEKYKEATPLWNGLFYALNTVYRLRLLNTFSSEMFFDNLSSVVISVYRQ